VKLVWTRPALTDLVRLHDFLETVNPRAADRVIKALNASAKQLLAFPRIGARLEEYGPREIRRLIVGDYELRYEIADDSISIVRIWHGKEDR
jgi:plasmid stabilization system protein ParE